MNSIFFGNILIHVALMATFLTIFFFTVASKLEAGIVKNQVNFVIDDIIGNTFQFIPTEEERKVLINNLINKLPDPEDLKSADEAVEKNNENSYNTAIHFLSILLGSVVAILLVMGIVFKWNLQDAKFLFISGIVGLFFVAITEFIFLILIARNFISADPNLIRSQAIKTIVCNSNSKIKNC